MQIFQMEGLPPKKLRCALGARATHEQKMRFADLVGAARLGPGQPSVRRLAIDAPHRAGSLPVDDAAPKPSFKHGLQAWCLHALTMSAVVQARVADSR
jgi:hypothetical protein